MSGSVRVRDAVRPGDVAKTNVDRQWLKFRTVPGKIVLFEVIASPGSAISCVRGVHGVALKVAIQSPPEKGKANAELEALIAEFVGIKRRQVRVVAGHTSRKKRVQVKGLLGPDFARIIAEKLDR